MSEQVYITGAGIISAVGKGTDATLHALVGGLSGIGGITLLDTIHKGQVPVAEVKMTNEKLAGELGIKGTFPTRTTMLGMIAAREAIRSAGIQDPGKPGTGFISATTVGGMDRSENFYAAFLETPSAGKLRDIIGHDCADSTEKIADMLGIMDFVTTVSTACSSSVNALILGANMIRSGQLERVIVGGTDSVTRFTLNGFNTLMILDRAGCHPFDENRAGLTLGEGAAYLVLESEESVRQSKKKSWAVVAGYGNANDAYHQTASSPEGTGAWLAMKSALEMSGLEPSDISYINVHGTGTQNNDLSEGIAMQRLFGDNVPPFSSTKPFTGHTLGAAGAVECVISLLAIKHQLIFPNRGFNTQMKELSITPVRDIINGLPVKHVLSNSFGFGGNNSSVIFSKA